MVLHGFHVVSCFIVKCDSHLKGPYDDIEIDAAFKVVIIYLQRRVWQNNWIVTNHGMPNVLIEQFIVSIYLLFYLNIELFNLFQTWMKVQVSFLCQNVACKPLAVFHSRWIIFFNFFLQFYVTSKPVCAPQMEIVKPVNRIGHEKTFDMCNN